MFAANKCLIGQNSQFRFLGVRFGDKTLIERLIADEVVFQPCFRHFRCTLHNRPIGLLDLLVTLEHGIKTGKGFGGTGKEHYSTRRSIQTMGHAKEHLTGLVILVLYIRLHRLAQRRVARLIALHNLVAGLVDGNNMIIFVEYFHHFII